MSPGEPPSTTGWQRHGVYVRELVHRMRTEFGPLLVASYLTGSAALDAFVDGRSDLDIIVVTGPCRKDRLRALARACSHRMLPCPAGRLELVLFPLEAVHTRAPSLDWALNLNTGSGGETVSFDPASEPRHGYVLDAAIAREHALTLTGPPPAETFAPLERKRIIDALRASIAWHRAHEPSSPSAILNACRGWAWVASGRWMSKPAAADWAAPRTEHEPVLRLALAIHLSASDRNLDPHAVEAVASEVERVLRAAAG